MLGLLTTSSASLAVPYCTSLVKGEILTLMYVGQLRVSHHLLDCADDINLFLFLLIQSTRRNTESLVVASRESKSKCEKTKYEYMKDIVMSRDRRAGQSNSIKIGNKSFEGVEQFIYLEITLTNQSFIHEEIKSRLNSGNACCHPVRNHLSSSSIRTDTNITRYRTGNFACLLYL